MSFSCIIRPMHASIRITKVPECRCLDTHHRHWLRLSIQHALQPSGSRGIQHVSVDSARQRHCRSRGSIRDPPWRHHVARSRSVLPDIISFASVTGRTELLADGMRHAPDAHILGAGHTVRSVHDVSCVHGQRTARREWREAPCLVLLATRLLASAKGKCHASATYFF